MIDSSDPKWKDNYAIVRKELEKYGHKLDQKEEVIALSKQDLNPKNLNEIIDEMTTLNKNKKFTISSFDNNELRSLLTIYLKKCEIDDDQ